jgi:hypothetical protein
MKPELPPAWLAVSDLKSKQPYLDEVFASEQAARAYLASEDASPGSGIIPDSPEAKIRLSAFPLAEPAHVTVRENWLKRHNQKLASFLKNPKTCELLVYAGGAKYAPLASRKAGLCPLLKGERWPVCSECGKTLGYAGVVRFAGSRETAWSHGDALVVFYCFECMPTDGETGIKLAWLKDGDALNLVKGRGAGPARIGSNWDLTEYAWDWEQDEKIRQLLHDQAAYAFFTFMWSTKIGGHLLWIQDDETPTCRCGQKMHYLGQISGHGELEFGDCGVGYLFTCSKKRCSDTKMVVQCS